MQPTAAPFNTHEVTAAALLLLQVASRPIPTFDAESSDEEIVKAQPRSTAGVAA
jgi:hypothetical protein